MKLIIEVEVPDKTVEEVQKFVSVEDAFDTGNLDDAIAPASVNAVDAFIAMYLSAKLDYTVTQAKMTNGPCYHVQTDRHCYRCSCPNYIGKVGYTINDTDTTYGGPQGVAKPITREEWGA